MRKYIDETIKRDFLAVAETTKINNITVSQILEPSGINRKTFYKHFSSIPDLICHILLDIYNHILEKSPDPLMWKDHAYYIMVFLKNNASFIERLFQSKYRTEIRLFLHKRLEIATRNFIRASQKDYEKHHNKSYDISIEQENYMVKLYTPFIYAWIEEWFVTGMHEDIKEFIEIVDKIAYGGIFECLSYFSEKTSENIKSTEPD